MAIPGDLPSAKRCPTGGGDERVTRTSVLHWNINLEGDRGNLVKLANWIEMNCNKDILEGPHSVPECAIRDGNNNNNNMPDVQCQVIGLEGDLEEMVKLAKGEDAGSFENGTDHSPNIHGDAHSDLNVHGNDLRVQTPHIGPGGQMGVQGEN